MIAASLCLRIRCTPVVDPDPEERQQHCNLHRMISVARDPSTQVPHHRVLFCAEYHACYGRLDRQETGLQEIEGLDRPPSKTLENVFYIAQTLYEPKNVPSMPQETPRGLTLKENFLCGQTPVNEIGPRLLLRVVLHSLL